MVDGKGRQREKTGGTDACKMNDLMERQKCVPFCLSITTNECACFGGTMVSLAKTHAHAVYVCRTLFL